MPDDFEEDTKMVIHIQKCLLWLGAQDIFLFTIYIMLNYVELPKYNNVIIILLMRTSVLPVYPVYYLGLIRTDINCL